MIPFAELTIGTAIQPSREWLQAVADGCEGLRAVVDVCGRLRTLADVSARNLDRTHHQPSDPQSETVTITYIRIRESTQHDSSKVLRLPHVAIWPSRERLRTAAEGCRQYVTSSEHTLNLETPQSETDLCYTSGKQSAACPRSQLHTFTLRPYSSGYQGANEEICPGQQDDCTRPLLEAVLDEEKRTLKGIRR